MYRITGPYIIGDDGGAGIMKRGVIIRHLVLPSYRRDSEAVLSRISTIVPPESVILSLMAQYTPDFLPAPATGQKDEYGKMRRKITTFEYESVRKRAAELGFCGYAQERSSATRNFTPDF